MKQKTIVKVLIHDCYDHSEYIANTVDDCRFDTDRMVYELVLEFGECITMGMIVGSLVKD